MHINYFKKLILTKKHFIYLILSGILLSLAWTTWGMAWTLFVALVPLFYIEDKISTSIPKNNRIIFSYAYIVFFVWNLITTWWVSNSTLGGGIAAVVLNSLFYTILFTFFHRIKKKVKNNSIYFLFLVFWLAWEYFYINGEISWIWLVLGNGFANNTSWIQWYEYTGTLGGSLWVLLVNVLVYLSIKKAAKHFFKNAYFFIALGIFILPIIFSEYLKYTYQEEKNPISFAIVQPNIDPYTEKFSAMPSDKQLEKMLSLIREKAAKNVDFFVLPETAIEDNIVENDFTLSKDIRTVQEFMLQYPNTSLITGATTIYIYPKNKKSETARKYSNGYYYDYFNTALQINKRDSLQKYHKSKLVIGVEMMPYPSFFRLFENFIISLGGTSGTLGTQKERSVFRNSQNKACVAPAVCYESIYGEFMTEFIQKGANVIFVITNDAWWGDTPGYKQHFSYSKLRAIENRRSIVRCANTGISAIINQKGEVEKHTEYWKEDVLNGSVNLNEKLTFYSQNGDYIGRIALFISYFWLLGFMLHTIYKIINTLRIKPKRKATKS